MWLHFWSHSPISESYYTNIATAKSNYVTLPTTFFICPYLIGKCDFQTLSIQQLWMKYDFLAVTMEQHNDKRCYKLPLRFWKFLHVFPNYRSGCYMLILACGSALPLFHAWIKQRARSSEWGRTDVGTVVLAVTANTALSRPCSLTALTKLNSLTGSQTCHFFPFHNCVYRNPLWWG